MDGPRDYHIKLRPRKIMSYDVIYMWNLKNYPNELIYKTETDSQTWKTNLQLSKGKEGGEG